MKYSELYRMLEAEGWQCTQGKRHYKFTHPERTGFIPVPRHEAKEVPIGTLRKILKDAGIK